VNERGRARRVGHRRRARAAATSRCRREHEPVDGAPSVRGSRRDARCGAGARDASRRASAFANSRAGPRSRSATCASRRDDFNRDVRIDSTSIRRASGRSKCRAPVRMDQRAPNVVHARTSALRTAAFASTSDRDARGRNELRSGAARVAAAATPRRRRIGFRRPKATATPCGTRARTARRIVAPHVSSARCDGPTAEVTVERRRRDMRERSREDRPLSARRARDERRAPRPGELRHDSHGPLERTERYSRPPSDGHG
jgi:hypothetical protein